MLALGLGRQLDGVSQETIGLWVVADNTFEGLCPVFIGAGSAGPVLRVRVEPVTVVILLTGICSDNWASRAASSA